jgi:protocatechuate 3,4-dioxygenase beta subunit
MRFTPKGELSENQPTWTRREWFGFVGGAAAIGLVQSFSSGAEAFRSRTIAGCVVSPRQEEGPYFVDEKLNRSDIRIDPSNGKVSAGVPLELTLTVMQVGKKECAPLAGATVDIWHCDAAGVYSDVKDLFGNFGDTRGRKFLRGYQVTDARGAAKFTTIYPGWYPGRPVHIHYKVRSADGKEFVSQLYFDEKITDAVHALEPYKSKKRRDTMNADDSIFRDGGNESIMAIRPKGEGYSAVYNVGFLI